MTGILVLGAKGQVGYELRRTMASLGEAISLECPDIDLSELANAAKAVNEIQPDIVCNGLAHSQVDKVEVEIDASRRLNTGLPRSWRIVQEARRQHRRCLRGQLHPCPHRGRAHRSALRLRAHQALRRPDHHKGRLPPLGFPS